MDMDVEQDEADDEMDDELDPAREESDDLIIAEVFLKVEKKYTMTAKQSALGRNAVTKVRLKIVFDDCN